MTDVGGSPQGVSIEAGITGLVSRTLGAPGQRQLDRDMELRSLGLDSQSIIALIATVEAQFGVQFGLDTPPEAFTSIAQLSDEVLRLLTVQHSSR